MLVFLQGMFGTVPWAVFFVYLADYLSQDISIGKIIKQALLFILAPKFKI